MTPVLETPIKAPIAYTKVLIFGVLILLCYAPAMRSMAGDWMSNEDMGHGFFVPLVAAYAIWQRKDELAAAEVKPNWWGLPIVLLGAVQSLIATLGVELFLSRSAIIVTVTGAVLLTGGTAVLRLAGFPLFLLCFMVPLPALIFNAVTFPLQILASQLAEISLTVIGIPVVRQGNILELPSGPLSVVEACSGIRSLLSLTFLSLVYGFFFEKSGRIRVALFLATIPIAILANGGRVTITGVLAEINPELAKGFFHESTGWVIFMLAVAILVVFHRAAIWSARVMRRKAQQ
jgi:exosortase